MSTFSKGLIMTIVALLASVISQNGLPHDATGWEILGITSVGTILLYIGKNAVFPSTTVAGSLSWADILSGLFMALSSGVSGWVATLVTGTAINWHSLITVMITTVVGYLAKTFMQTPAPKGLNP